jgi:hypothetical protein
MLAHIHPPLPWFVCEDRPLFNGLASPWLSVRDYPRPATCAESLCPIEALPRSARCLPHLVRGRYPSFFAPTNSCANPIPSRLLRFPLFDRSLQVVASLCWVLDLPSVISTNPSAGVWTPTPVGSHGALARFFPYPGRDKVTSHERVGCKSHSCLREEGRSDQSDERAWGSEHNGMSAAPKSGVREKSLYETEVGKPIW